MRSLYQDMLNRSYNTLFPACVQWPKLLKKGFQVPRYPAPASEKVSHIEHDFKLAYRDSMYHVRHNEYVRDMSTNRFVSDPISETLPQKLVRVRLLSKKDIDNQEAIAQAKSIYDTKYGLSADQKIYDNQFDDEELDSVFSGTPSREQFASLVRNQFEALNEHSIQDSILCNLEDDDQPSFNDKIGHNINENDPVFRQLIVDLHTVLARFGERNEKLGYQKFFQGDPNYWHQLDNTFKPEQIKLVQTAILDEVSQTDPAILKKDHNSEQYHREVKVQYPYENKYYK